jgi:putative transposase
MCQLFKVSSSGYYKYLKQKPSKREERRNVLKVEIEKAYRSSKCRYGSPRITKQLNMQGINVSKILVAKLMKELNLKSIVRKRYKATTDASHTYPVAEHLLNRVFRTDKENVAWVSDITYIPTGQGWLYVTSILDLYDRKVIGWSFSTTLKAKDTVVAAFTMARNNRPIQSCQPLIFHSDRGVQYACTEFTDCLKQHPSLSRSMSRKGNCWDNAVAESFFKTLKTELTNQHNYQTRAEAELSIFEYIETFYNTCRRHKHLDNQTITEFNPVTINNLKNAA